jgi:hypothetical protein
MIQRINIVELLHKSGWTPRKPATEKDILSLKERFKIALPQDYEEVLRASSGCSLYGFKTPLIIYSIIEVLALFREHDLYEKIPQSLIFGGDGGGTLYCYDLRSTDSEEGYNVFFVREDDIGYDKIIYQSPSLTDMVLRIIDNEKIN